MHGWLGGFFIGWTGTRMLMLAPLYSLSGGMDDLVFYRGIVLWMYGSFWGVVPAPRMDGTPNPMLYKWWEASLN